MARGNSPSLTGRTRHRESRGVFGGHSLLVLQVEVEAPVPAWRHWRDARWPDLLDLERLSERRSPPRCDNLSDLERWSERRRSPPDPTGASDG